MWLAYTEVSAPPPVDSLLLAVTEAGELAPDGRSATAIAMQNSANYLSAATTLLDEQDSTGVGPPAPTCPNQP